MTDIRLLQQQIEHELNTLHFEELEPRELYEPIAYILSLGGKRMRPLLVLLGYELFMEDASCVVRSSLMVEVFHNFTLMHDDIMDAAPLRRGKPTVHAKWSSTIAILSGDTMLVKAYELLGEIAPEKLPEALRLFNTCAIEVCEGQQIDINFESRSSVTVEEYIEMIRLKTAVLLGFSLEYGALLAGMPARARKQVYEVGVKMGIGFQLMDDLLDVYADQAKFGKQVGGDIISNKKTFLLIKALELASGSQREQLQGWISRKDFDPAEKIKAVTSIYDQLGIRELTSQQMNAFFDESFGLLDGLDVRPEGKQVLNDFARQLMNREK